MRFWYLPHVLKRLVTSFICSKFQTNSLKSNFKQMFNDLIHVYSPRAGAGAGADSPQGTKF